MVRRALMTRGFEVVSVSNIAEATRACDRETFDVFILDADAAADLTWVSGDLTRCCRGGLVTTAGPDLAVTGPWQVLRKPYTLEELHSALLATLEVEPSDARSGNSIPR